MRRLFALAAVVGMVFVMAIPAQAAKPVLYPVDDVQNDAACNETVDIIETGWVRVHPHTNGKIAENVTYHLDVTFTDGETEVFFRDRGRDQVIYTDTGLEINLAGRLSGLYDGENAHIGNMTLVITFGEPDLFEWTVNGGQDVNICGQFA